VSAARAKEILLDALELDGAERGGFVERACAGDEELRRRVDGLLAAHDRADELVADVPVRRIVARDTPDVGPGDRIGDYVLKRELGSGGFGTVFHAEQLHPVRRDVALKVLKLGMDSRAVVGRFEDERQAVAIMEHPNIAKALDAGTTEAGRPFFVMELVDGVPITHYCEQHGLARTERLELFRTVCHAIQHAHQKGILHRDIKPSNVLVTTVDGRPVPKVIDFGVAKAIDPDPAGRTLLTHDGQLVGTPSYMSPEQAGGGADIDTRSDVYSLGALLYELLTGECPLDADGGPGGPGGLAEILRQIREVDPPRPSLRVRGAPGGRASATWVSVPRDLDWICMKALEKERNRRYPTAFALALDVERFLGHEPVQAAPPSTWYRIVKLARRHTAATVAVVSLFSALVVGIAGTSWGLVAATRANERLDAEATRARRAEADASRQAAEAHRQADIARAINDFLNEDLLGAAAPSASSDRGPEVTMREVLDAAARRIEEAGRAGGRFADAPLVEASLRLTLSDAYVSLGLYDRAEVHVLRAVALAETHLGPEDASTLRATTRLAHVQSVLRRPGEAEENFLRAVAEQERVLGPTHVNTLHAMGGLATAYWREGRYADAARTYEEALERARSALGERHDLTLSLLAGYAVVADSMGDFERSGELYRRSYELRLEELGPAAPETLASMNNLASFLIQHGTQAEADALLVETLAVQREVMGVEHPDTVTTLHNLAQLRMAQRRYDEAEALLEEAVEGSSRVDGPDGPHTLQIRSTRAKLLIGLQRYAEAERILADVVARCRVIHGPSHPTTLSRLKDLANALYVQGRTEEALELLLETLEGESDRLGRDHPNTLRSEISVAMCLRRLDRLPEAADTFAGALERARGRLGDDDPMTLGIASDLAEVLLRLERFGEAEGAARLAVEGARRSGGDASRLGASLLRLGQSLLGLARFEEAEPVLREAHELLAGSLGPGSDWTAEARFALASLYRASGREDLAREWE